MHGSCVSSVYIGNQVARVCVSQCGCASLSFIVYLFTPVLTHAIPTYSVWVKKAHNPCNARVNAVDQT